MISLSPLPVFKDTDLNNDLPALLLTTLSPFRTLPPRHHPLLTLPQPRIPRLRRNPLNNPRRIPHHHAKILHILRHHTSRTNSNTPPDRHPGQHNSVPSKPAVFTYSNGSTGFRALGAVAEKWVERVDAREETAVWTDERSGADGDGTGVDECAGCVYECSFA